MEAVEKALRSRACHRNTTQIEIRGILTHHAARFSYGSKGQTNILKQIYTFSYRLHEAVNLLRFYCL